MSAEKCQLYVALRLIIAFAIVIMRLYIIISLLLSFGFNTVCADEYPTLETDKARIDWWLQRAMEIVNEKRDSALIYTKKAYSESKRTGYEAGEAEGAKLLGTNEMYNSNYEKASEYYKEAIAYYKQQNDLKKLADLYTLEGIKNGMQNKSALALDWFLKALSLSEQVKDDANVADLNFKIGIIYGQVEDYENALAYQQKAIDYGEETSNKKLLMAAYGNMGMLLGQKEDYKQSLVALRKAKALTMEIGNVRNLPNVYLNLGNVFRETGQYDSSRLYLNQALQIYTKAAYPLGIAGSANALADLYLRERKYDSVFAYARQSLALAEQFKDRDLQYQNNYFLIRAYLAKSNYKEASGLIEGLLALRDSVDENRSEAIVERTRLSYELDQKNSSISALEAENKAKTMQRNLLLAGSAGGIIFTMVVFLGFYKIRKKNRQLRAQKENLQELNSVKDKLFSVLSHDLRSPLSGMLGVLPLMESKLLTEEEEKEMLGSLRMSASNTLETLDNLLMWGSSQMKNDGPVTEHVNVREVSLRAVALYNNVATQKGVTVVNSIGEECIARFDSNQLEFIVRNLLANAIKFSYKDQQVELRGRCADGRIVLEVEDHGTGMTEEALKNLFDPQKKERKKGTSGESGVGLGLTLISEFLAKNGGTISATSTPGRGTCFTVIVPGT